MAVASSRNPKMREIFFTDEYYFSDIFDISFRLSHIVSTVFFYSFLECVSLLTRTLRRDWLENGGSKLPQSKEERNFLYR
jgi:hypothetical protein